VSDYVIDLQSVSKRYPHYSLNQITLGVRDGTVLGLVGPNGAGKSTLIRILMGLVRADRGRVTVLGRQMPAEEPWIKARVGFVSEDMALYSAETIGWHMRLVRDMSDGWDDRRAAALLDRFSLNPNQRAGGLSSGPCTAPSAAPRW
jgi:ABC-2 type transport system ATP-binding protein